MKSISMAFILCIILCSVNTMADKSKSGHQNNDRIAENISQSTAKDLQISLTTDKATYSKGDEIHFTIDLKNVSSHPLRVLIDNEFVGSNIECSDNDGNRYAYEGGYNSWSPKAGIYTGRTHLIQPNSKMEFKLDALLFDNYSLIFSNQFDRKGSNNFQQLKSRNNLPSNFPDKYISAGRIYKLPKAGKYHFTYVYQATESDKNWKFAGAKTPQRATTDLLWVGRTASNTIELSLK